MHLRVKQVTGEKNAFLRNIDREIASAVTAPFGGDLKGQVAEIERHAAVEGDVRLHQFFAFVRRIARVIRIPAFVETSQLLHLQIMRLGLGGYVNRFILPKNPSARGVIEGAMRRDQVANFFVRELANTGEDLVGVGDVEIEDHHSLLSQHHRGVVSAAGILKHIDAVGDLDRAHFFRCAGRYGHGPDNRER